MKAPDKIYIDDLAIVNDCSTKVSIEPLPNFSEYISKDALLRWAKEKRKIRWNLVKMDNNDRFSAGCVSMLDLLIDKLKAI